MPVRDAELVDRRFAALAHGRGDAGEIAFFPKCFVRIHANAHVVSLCFNRIAGRTLVQPGWTVHGTKDPFRPGRG